MLLILGFTLTILFGLLTSLSIAPRMFTLERLGLAYILGIGLQTFVMFLLYLLGFDYSLNLTLITLTLIIFVLLIFNYRQLCLYISDLRNDLNLTNINKNERLIILLIVLLFLYSFVSTLYWPVSAWDSLVLYDWRAKLFFNTGNMNDAIARGYFFGVPLLTSLSHTWVYFLKFSNPEFIYSLFFASFVVMFYGSLREYSSRFISMIAILLLSTLPDVIIHSTFSYTNFPFTVYFVMSTIYLYTWMRYQKTGYLILSAILLGLSAWTRSTEPFWIANIIVFAVYCIYNRKFLHIFVIPTIFFAIRQPWIMFESNYLTYDSSIGNTIAVSFAAIVTKINPSHILEVATFLYVNVIVYLMPFVTLYALVILFDIKKFIFSKEYWLFGFIIMYLGLLVAGTYVFSLTFTDWRIGGSASRMIMFIPPLILFSISASGKVNSLFKQKKRLIVK